MRPLMASSGGPNNVRRYHSCLVPVQHSWWHLCAPTFVIIFVIIAPTSQNQLKPPSDSAPENGICQSMDIRNSLDAFEMLRGCRVVEGFVQILLIDSVNETLLSMMSFPELTEITDFLLLYRVSGLRSIGQLFPNLTVIHGKNTHKYDGLSLMIFEMPSLQEIGLYSLTNITGHVRIDKNPSLCFVNTIDWKLISSDRWVQYIYTSKPDNECPLCPGDENPKAANAMPFSCPKAPGNSKHHLCWNRQHCQKVCRPNCTACNNKGECCSPDCLGGCADDDVNHCSACRHLELIDEGNQRRCVKNCPKDFYKFLDRRCIQKEECMKLNRPLVAPTKAARPAKPYLIFQDSCVLDCPVGYMSDFENRTCKLCEGGCKKDCPGLNVDSIESVKQLQGCTNITGSLEIQLRGGNKIVNELEESLGLIEEIQGHLKIVRSFSILSLSFLKSLKVIRGEQLDSGKYSFIVLDNQNLQELWNFTEHKIQILKGRLFFHFNPKLCLSKIEELAKVASLGNITDMEVAKASNGDKVACNVVNLEVSVTATFPTAVTLIWSHLEIQDQRSLLGYIVYIIEAPHKNITLYDGRDACGNDGWRVDDVQLPENQDENVTHLVSRLKPYTQYAFYVKTYTIATENRGAQSKINYFRTKPATPMVPDDLNIKRVGYDSLKITWRPPRVPNGKIVQYFVSGKKMNFSTAENDFCRYDLTTRPQSIMLTPKPEPPKVNNENTCVCQENTKSQFSSMEDEEAMRIGFEDELQNHVYVKKGEEVYRSKRDSNSESSTFPTLKYEKENEGKERKNLTHEGYFTQFFLEVNGSKTEVLINQLHHYTYYDIYVQACREGERDPQTPRCSNEVYKHERTSLKPGADNITNVRKLHSNLTSVTITWDEPKDPNGLVLSYNIEYRRSDIENAQPTPECITHKNFIKQGRKYTLKLNPGNYSLRVSAQTSNGMGEKSQPINFYVNESTSYLAIILGVLISFLIAGSIMFAYLWRRQKKQILVPYINPEYAPTVYIPDEWEMPRKNVELIKELGQGSFGMVWEGLLTEKGKPPIKCAVKTVNEHATKKERSEFLREASRMKAFDTAHVVHLLGVVSQGQPTLVIMELMAHGDLKLYLRSLRPDADTYDPTQKQPPSLNRILQMAIEIADGMAYLSAKKFIHNDLAARNCMVTENFTVKVGDFGMARDVYETDYYRKGSTGLLPVRWMAPESLKDGIFSSSSDVWSYGVVLWEMATLASQPYQGLSNDQVLRYVIGRGVMARPEHCPDQLYGLMRVCWKHQADERPSFIKIVSMLLDYARPDFCNISFYHSAAGIEARPAPSLSQDDASTPLRVAPDVNFSETYSDSNDEMGSADDHMEFPSITMGHPTTANGYISGRPTNGAATTQC